MSNSVVLQKYLELFAQMNRASCGRFVAPHKPILLLSILSLVERGIICENKILLDDELIGVFKEYWRMLIDDGSVGNDLIVCEELFVKPQNVYPFKCSIQNPYYHLSSEPFWKLVKSEYWEKKPEYSLTALRRSYKYAEIDEELFSLMKDESSRKIIREYLENLI